MRAAYGAAHHLLSARAYRANRQEPPMQGCLPELPPSFSWGMPCRTCVSRCQARRRQWHCRVHRPAPCRGRQPPQPTASAPPPAPC